MVITTDFTIPSDEELTVQEVNLSISALRAGAVHLGKHCEYDNNEFMLCRNELKDPRKCLEEGKSVTKCTLDFFRKVKKSCHDEFTQYATCLERSTMDMQYAFCRKTQAVFDRCVLDNMNIERPSYGYFTKVRVHDSKRPAPEPEPPTVFEGTPTPLPPNKGDHPPARYGARNII